MFALAARRLGYRVHVLVPEEDSPTAQVSDREVVAPYADLDAVAEFARGVDVVTFEFENVPAATAETAERIVPVRPAGTVLHATQNRLREKAFLRRAGLPVPAFAPVLAEPDVAAAVRGVGRPAVLKTAAWGYDGRGQVRVDSEDAALEAWRGLGGAEAVLEAWVDFECEVSVVAARGLEGEVALFGPLRNHHERHILDLSVAPAGLGPRVEHEARELARAVVEAFDLVGVLCVEMFLTRDGTLLVNEIAPRPHNSGHLTIEGHETSQFEQQVRAVCGLPLGSVRPVAPAAMVNLLGDLWQRGEPDWRAALAVPGVALHLYGKTEPRPGRKMGHLTALGTSPQDAEGRARHARDVLAPPIGDGVTERLRPGGVSPDRDRARGGRAHRWPVRRSPGSPWSRRT
jgi:5-(carboxyamino)imidazole ribonucleotide synthase